jgi:hypothetical protein
MEIRPATTVPDIICVENDTEFILALIVLYNARSMVLQPGLASSMVLRAKKRKIRLVFITINLVYKVTSIYLVN